MTQRPIVQKLLFTVLCVSAGWISAFAMQPVSWWPCLFIGISALYYAYSRTVKPMQAFAAGFLFGIGYFVTGLWWIGNALLVEGNDFAWVWPLSVIGLPTLLGLFTGLYLACARMLASPRSVAGFFAFCFGLTFAEWARGTAFTGFPWNLFGYTWADHLPMAQIANIIGAYGLTFLTVIWAAAAGFIAVGGPGKHYKAAILALTIVTMAGVYASGHHRLENNPTKFHQDTGVVIVQPNIAQTMKWDPLSARDNFLKTISLSRDAAFAGDGPAQIYVVWPETAISPQIYSDTVNMLQIRAMLGSYDADAYLVTGILRRDETPRGPSYANSIAFVDSSLNILDSYDKTHLVPFGEYIPFQDWIPLEPVAAFKGFTRGKGATALSAGGGRPFSPLICYEVIFPDRVTPRVPASRPEWIVNVTNDGWYGLSAGPHQHFAQTRMRAIEEGIPVARSANTGISGMIDAYGRIVDSAGLNENARIVSLLPMMAAEDRADWRWALQMLLPFTQIILLISTFFKIRKSY